ncbi:MAG: hypothetical protein MR639_12785 [Clostridium sp.]|uniref:hypothetical protein n=1 Tax=Clostridium sp. TaxID=1506 RepID=UPI002A8F8E0E|nr:hypothetical protein [Clostridium sp.]MDY5099522.1 hypothetical protein [Clostridium sp.]
MILFQLGIFEVIIISSFFGILPLIGALIFIALFTLIYLFTNFSKVALIITLVYLLWSIQDIKYYDRDASYISYGLVTFIIFYLMKKIFIAIAFGQAYLM